MVPPGPSLLMSYAGLRVILPSPWSTVPGAEVQFYVLPRTKGVQLLLLLLLMVSPTLGAAVAGSNTLGVGTAIAVSTRVGGENIFESCSIASFITVPCCSNGVAG